MLKHLTFAKIVNKGAWVRKLFSCFQNPIFSLDIAEGCPFQCTYCILQSYFKNKQVSIYYNFLDCLNDVDYEIKTKASNSYVSTGIFSDSLIINKLFPFFESLYFLAEKNPNTLFELRSKTALIDNIKDNEKNLNNILFTWTLSPQFIISNLEKNTASAQERISAAYNILQKGYKIAFHLDPIIYYHNWFYHYQELLQLVRDFIPDNNIKFFTIGCLRFPESFLNIINNKYKNHWLFQIEFIPIYKDTYSYPRFIRKNLYAKLIQLLNQHFDKKCEIKIMEADKSFSLLK
jgi:spore photoproduct lyase